MGRLALQTHHRHLGGGDAEVVLEGRRGDSDRAGTDPEHPVPSSTVPGQWDSARNETVMPAEMPRSPSSRGAIMPMSRMKVRRAVSI